MKKIKTTFSVLILGVTILASTACKDNKEKDTTADKNQQVKAVDENQDEADFSPVIKNYFELKDALVESDETEAKKAGKKLLSAIADFDKSEYPEQEEKINAALSGAQQHAKLISDGSLEEQRKSFKELSGNISDFASLTENEGTIYQDFCPMYDDGKGGIWLSATKEIKNPYYGDKMMKCGTVQKTISS